MTDFFLNKQFFDFLIDKSYPLGKDFFLHVHSRQTIGSGYCKFYRYEIDFEVFYEQSEFIPLFARMFCYIPEYFIKILSFATLSSSDFKGFRFADGIFVHSNSFFYDSFS